MKILFCPSHYVFDDGDRGSELSWAYHITHNVIKSFPRSVVVTGFKNLKSNKPYKIIELQKGKKSIDLGLINTVVFNFLYSKYALQVLKRQKFEILHHVLPFAIDRTYNFSIILSSSESTRKIIGPIQSPLPFYADNIHDVGSTRKGWIIAVINKLVPIVLQPILSTLSRRTLIAADKIIVINEYTKQLLLDRGINGNKIITIPPGVDCKRFNVSKTSPKNRVELIAVGSLIERKGFDVMLKGISKLKEKNNNFHLKIIGDGPQREYLEKTAKDYELNDVLSFEGYVSHRDIDKYYEKSDIFINMSRAEGFATVCLEAMASGLAVVSTKVGGYKEAVSDGEDGFIISIDSFEDLAEKINILMEDKKMLQKFKINARKKMEEYYDWERAIIPEYLNVYERDDMI